jgi:phosphoribosyl-ATP pyrophosphohydrolase/phosphoribosyl-AMP cyclohydrolase
MLALVASFAVLDIRFDDRGLVPVVAQDSRTGRVRMVAWANREAVAATLASGRATFFSRSRGGLWEKGKTSGHALRVRRVLVDCDADALLYEVEPEGPSCHTGEESCFFREVGGEGAQPGPVLERLERVLEARKASTAEKSYVKSLYQGGAPRIGDKVREEAGEYADALAGEADERVVSEAADVLFHVLVGLSSRGLSVRAVLGELDRRFGVSGHAEKASREKAREGV